MASERERERGVGTLVGDPRPGDSGLSAADVSDSGFVWCGAVDVGWGPKLLLLLPPLPAAGGAVKAE